MTDKKSIASSLASTQLDSINRMTTTSPPPSPPTQMSISKMSRNNRNQRGRTRTIFLILLGVQSILAILSIFPHQVQACGPGRAGGRRLNRLRKYPPLVQRQYIPNVSENTFGASGAPEGPIKRQDKRFKELVQNWNPDIEFRDDERTGADRMMSQRLKEKLSVLAISVMNQWPNVRLRVIEGWDEDRRHSANSLHYEGRAVDITTSDKDRSKYGLLARLAVEAGFDWVHYESRSHVHCSVKSEKADSIRNNGCFDANSLVETPMGQMEMSQLHTNDLVLTMNPQTGELQYSPVLMWMDRDETSSELYVNLTTKSGKQIRLTSSHLIYLADEPMPPAATATNLVNGDLSKNNNNNNQGGSLQTQTKEVSYSGSHYYYDFVGGASGGSSAAARRQAEPSASGEGLPSIDESMPAQLLASTANPSTTSPATEQATDQLSDYVYTTYARNAVAGQYLLIHEPLGGEELRETTTTNNNNNNNHESMTDRNQDQAPYTPFGLGRGSGSGNRLVFSFSNRNTSPHRWAMLNQRYRPPISGVGEKKTKVVFDEIVSVKYVSRHGIYAPLTRDGNIVVNSVVASCYAVISDHDMAHWSMAPVRWFSLLNEKLFGLKPETPTYERTVGYLNGKKLYEERRRIEHNVQEQSQRQYQQLLTTSDQHEGMKYDLDHNTTNGLNRTLVSATSDARHVHWYPILLYNIARYVLPNNYLY